jgi:hypothetical protein
MQPIQKSFKFPCIFRIEMMEDGWPIQAIR